MRRRLLKDRWVSGGQDGRRRSKINLPNNQGRQNKCFFIKDGNCQLMAEAVSLVLDTEEGGEEAYVLDYVLGNIALTNWEKKCWIYPF